MSPLHPPPNPYQNPKPNTINHQTPVISQSSTHQHSSLRPSIIYFENYPDHWFYSDLERAFEKFGVFGKVIITRRKNKRNRRFGFLHVDQKLPIDEVVSRLNTITIGYFKIRAFISKYPKPSFPAYSHSGPHHQQVKFAAPAQFTQARPVKASIRDSRSFANVVSNESIHYNTETQVIPSSLLVSVRCITNLLQVNSFLESNGIRFSSSSFLGGSYMLLNFENNPNMDTFKRKAAISFPDYFDKVLPWDGSFVAKERYTWLTFTGIPIFAWNEEFFILLGNRFGKSISVHNLIITKERMDAGSILISTSSPFIDCSVSVYINGKEFIINAKESDLPMMCSVDTNSLSPTDSSYTDSESESLSPPITSESKIPSAQDSPVFILHEPATSSVQEDSREHSLNPPSQNLENVHKGANQKQFITMAIWALLSKFRFQEILPLLEGYEIVFHW